MLRAIYFASLAFAATLLCASSSVANAAQMELYGVNYNIRKGADWTSPAEKCKTEGEVDLDFATLATITKRIRIYSLTDCNQGAIVLAAASRHNLLVELGLWVNAHDDVFEAEKNQLKELAKSGLITKERVSAIHVGSEAVYRGEVTSTKIIGLMEQIKSIRDTNWPSIPVTIADIGDVYLAHPDLVAAVDFVSANGFPFWEKKEASESAAYFHTRMAPLIEQAKSLNKTFVISETGWPTQGSNVNASVASPANAKRYLEDFHALANANNWKYYYFEAFDELWKLSVDPNNTVEAYFGIFNADRTVKAAYADLTLTMASGSTQESAIATGSSTSNSSNNGTSTIAASGNASNATTTGNGNANNAASGSANNAANGASGNANSESTGSAYATTTATPTTATPVPVAHDDCDVA